MATAKCFGAMAVLPGAFEPKKRRQMPTQRQELPNPGVEWSEEKPSEMIAITSPFLSVQKVKACPRRSKPTGPTGSRCVTM